MRNGDKEYNILIIDDSSFMRNLIYNYIKDIKNIKEFFYAYDYNSAIDILQSKSNIINIVTLDLTLNLNMNDKTGIDVLKYIKEHNYNINVIICSAMGQSFVIKEAIELGAKEFIIKPFDKNNLCNIIKRYMK